MRKKIPGFIYLIGILSLVIGVTLITSGYSVALSGGKQKMNSKNQSPREIIQLLDAHLPGLTPANVDGYIFRLIELQTAAQKNYEQLLFSEPTNSKINQYQLEDLNLHKVKEPELKTLIRSIFSDGFKLSSSEGMIYLEADYNLLFKRYRPFASKPMSQYLMLMGLEADRHYAEDAGLIVGLEQLSSRIVATEKFNDQYPNFARSKDIRQLHQRYLSAYLIGLNNTPAFDYQTNQLNDNFRDNYQNTVTKYPDTQLAKITKQYLTLLEKNHYQKTQTILDFAKKFE